MPQRFQVPPATYDPLLITSGVRAMVQRAPDKVALICESRELSYWQLMDRVDRLSHRFASEYDLSVNDAVAIFLPNQLEYIEIVFALSQLGVAAATINHRLSASELFNILGDCKAKLVITTPALLEQIQQQLEIDLNLLLVDEHYEQALSDCSPIQWQDLPDIPEWQPFALPYTSGTTGHPKGVMLSHRSRSLLTGPTAAEFGCFGEDDKFLALAPLAHGAGFAFPLTCLSFGGCCEILPSFNPEHTLQKLSEGGFTGVFMVPTHFSAIFKLPEDILSQYKTHQLKAIISNAAPLAQEMKKTVIDYWGEGLLYEIYGSTEASIVTVIGPKDQLRKTNCVGTPFAFNQVRVINDDGEVVKPGEVGELYSKSPFLFNGYLNLPEEDSKSLIDGWFSAGDMATVDEEGFIYIVDRKKDMVITGGMNVYPREIEQLLLESAMVSDAAVIGVDDDHWGERLRAFVQVADGAEYDQQQLQDFCRGKLADYKIPKEFITLDRLPRSVTGKLLKQELRTID